MQSFTRAMDTAINNNAPVMAAFTGGYSLNRLPEDVNYPYLVMSIVATPLTTAYRGPEFYEPTCRFTGFGVGQDALIANMQTLIAFLDQTSIAITAMGNMFALRKTDILPSLTQDVDGNGNEVARCDVIYDFGVQSF